MNKLTIRQRIYLSLASFAMLSIVGFGSAIVFSSDYLEARLLEDAYHDELIDIKANLKKGRIELPQSSHVKAYWGTSGNVPNEFIRYGEGNYHDISFDGHDYHLYVTPLNNDYLYIAFKIDVIEHYEDNLSYVLIVTGTSFLALCLWFSWWLTQFIAYPVSTLANAVNQLSPNTPLLSETDDPELGVIEQAINNYIEDIQHHLLRERQFSGMASHELRTPIATILATLETFKEDSNLNERQQLRIDRLLRSSHELKFIAESLLTTIKGVSTGEHAEINDVATTLQHLIGEYKALYTRRNIELKLENTQPVFQSHTIFTRIIIGNLIRNSLSHTDNGDVHITLTNQAILVRDNGHGLPRSIRDWLNTGTEIPYKEMGLGLYIVKTLCEKLSWQVRAEKNLVFIQIKGPEAQSDK